MAALKANTLSFPVKHTSNNNKSTLSLPSHKDALASALNLMRQEGKLCDVTLVCKGKQFAAHQNVLASCSQHFLRTFVNGENKRPPSGVPPSIQVDVDPKIMEIVLDFVYMGKAKVHQNDIEPVMAAAHNLKLSAIYEHCRAALCETLSPVTYRHIWQIAEQFNDEVLRQRAILFAANNFESVSLAGEDFVQLTMVQLKKLLSHDELNVPSQDKLLEAIITWVKRNTTESDRNLSPLLSYVKFEHLSKPYLQVLVENEEIVWETPELMRHITQTVCTRYLHGEESLTPSPTDGSKNGDTSEETEIAIAVFGESENKKIVFQCYSLDQEEWSPPEELPLQLTNTAIVTVHGTVYFVGGKRNNVYLKSIYLYSLEECKLMEGREMQTSRSHAGLAELDGYVYAIGGYNSTGFLSSVERYSVTKNHWYTMASLSEPKGGVGVASINKRIYAIGGRTGNSVSPSKTVECYDVAKNQWTIVLPMVHARSHCGVAVLNQRIYVTGGFAKDAPTSTNLQCYDPVLKLWQELSAPPAEDWITAAVASGGILYVMTDGGQIFRYDPIRKLWSSCTLFPTIPGYYVAAVLVNKPVWDT